MVTCPACGQENPDSSRFCGMCGAPLTAAPAPPREERKVVTILFTDLVGFSDWALQVGDGPATALLRAVDSAITPAIELHGGRVVKRLGDGAMKIGRAHV